MAFLHDHPGPEPGRIGESVHLLGIQPRHTGGRARQQPSGRACRYDPGLRAGNLPLNPHRPRMEAGYGIQFGNEKEQLLHVQMPQAGITPRAVQAGFGQSKSEEDDPAATSSHAFRQVRQSLQIGTRFCQRCEVADRTSGHQCA